MRQMFIVDFLPILEPLGVESELSLLCIGKLAQ